MSTDKLPWAVRFRPRVSVDLANNREAVNEFRLWLCGWEKGIPERRAAFIHGPPGVGKTSTVHVIAVEMGFDLLEINASDYRTRTRMEELIGRAATQNITIFGKRRMILFDEMEGISGREDQGGIDAIVDIIKETRSPIVLIATAIAENNEDKFRTLRDKAQIIEFRRVPVIDVFNRLKKIMDELGINAPYDALEALAIHSEGDLRSAINDLESLVRGNQTFSIEDVAKLGIRDRKEYTPNIVRNIFSAHTVWEARKAINQAYVNHEELFDWIYENLPLVLDDRSEMYEGLMALARADILDRQATISSYRLQKYMFNDMTAGVALSRVNSEGLGLKKQLTRVNAKLGYPPNTFSFHETSNGLMVKPTKYMGDEWRKVNENLKSLGAVWVRGGNGWLIPYLRAPQIKWRYIRTYHSRRKLSSISEKLALKCHSSKKDVVMEIIPLIKLMYKNQKMVDELSSWLGIDEDEKNWLMG